MILSNTVAAARELSRSARVLIYERRIMRAVPPSLALAILLAACADRAPAPESARPDRPTPSIPTASSSVEGASPVSGFDAAAFASHVRELEPRVPAGFTVVVEPPFVVVGDEAPAVVRRRAASTVRWAVVRLKRDFFDRDPLEIIDIWLFKDEASYRKHAFEIFGDRPDTPYGYYSTEDRAMVMNIQTGGGTLVHEIVHPFMRANFPEAPAWFDEGLGSLFEQSADRGGHIVGLTNWRLAGLKEAIAAGELPSFATLTATTDHEFYDRDPGTNYAQARYLLYYLQQRDLLLRFFREFRSAHEDDPTGLATLQAVLGETDMAAFQRRWEAWVMELSFPPST
jgi:hypothetical protein